MTLTLKMEDATAYLPHDPTGIEYRWYVINDAKTHPLTKKPLVEMAGTKADCEAFIARHARAFKPCDRCGSAGYLEDQCACGDDICCCIDPQHPECDECWGSGVVPIEGCHL